MQHHGMVGKVKRSFSMRCVTDESLVSILAKLALHAWLSSGHVVCCQPRNFLDDNTWFVTWLGSNLELQVDVLSRVRHKNLVALVGYCQEDKKQILIYEYMHNGSLHDELRGNQSLLRSVCLFRNLWNFRFWSLTSSSFECVFPLCIWI